jgi:hypothetical protein
MMRRRSIQDWQILFLLLAFACVLGCMPVPGKKTNHEINTLLNVGGINNDFIACAYQDCWYFRRETDRSFSKMKVNIPNYSELPYIRLIKPFHSHLIALSELGILRSTETAAWQIVLHESVACGFDYLICTSIQCVALCSDGEYWLSYDGKTWDGPYCKIWHGSEFSFSCAFAEGEKVVAYDASRGYFEMLPPGKWGPYSGQNDQPKNCMNHTSIEKVATFGTTKVSILGSSIYWYTSSGNWLQVSYPKEKISKVLKEWTFKDVCVSDGIFVVVGTGELVMTSKDGQHWEVINLAKIKYERESEAILLIPVPIPDVPKWY